MSSGGRLSRKEKGKAVALESSHARDVDGTPLDDFELVHQEAMMDTRSLGLPERLLVSESARLHRREVARTTTEAQLCARDGQEGAKDGTPPIDFVPICYYPCRIFEEMPPLSPESLRSPKARGKTWGNVLPTRSTVGSDDTKLWFPIPRLVTSYVRRRDGTISQFLNGSWRLAVALMVMAAEINVTLNVRVFEELTYVNPLDEGLWSIKMRPNYNVVKGYPNKKVNWQRSYFYIKSDDSAFEDPPDDNCRVLWNALLADHPTSCKYSEEFLSNARVIERLQPERWGNVTRDRIRRGLDRISKRDWKYLYLLETNTVKRRILLFTRDEQRAINASRGMKGLPNLSAMMASQLGLPRPEPVNPPSEVGVTKTTEKTTTPARQDLPPVVTATSAKKRGDRKRSCDDLAIHETRDISLEGVDATCQENTAKPPRAKKRKRQPNNGPSPVREGPSLNFPLADDPDDASPPASLQLTRKPRRTSEQEGSRPEAPPGATSDTSVVPNVAEGPILATVGTSTGGVPVLKKVPRVVFPDRVSFGYDGPSPLIYIPHKCAELVSQIRGGPRSLPPVADLFFKDEYVDAARTKLLSDRSMNFVIEKYNAALKEALANSEKLKEKSAAKGRFFRRKAAEWTAAYKEMVAKRERAIAQKKIHQERANVAEADLRIANATISTLETKTGQLKEKIRLETESHKKELARLRESRTFEVTKERVRVETEMIAKCNKRFENICDYQTRRAPFDTMRLLQSQAFDTRKCLEALKDSGRDILQETIKMFVAQEKHFEEEALKLDVEEIPEADLTLSPLKLDSQFVDEHIMVGVDPFGSNTNLIDARTASLLHTPSSSRGLHAGTLASPDHRPTDETATFSPGGD
ncbi:hypothetical protein N665_0117s0030 [Sinapis alba]|nr:hypothetical protein N665_0117s0030 [Sinapis alba]